MKNSELNISDLLIKPSWKAVKLLFIYLEIEDALRLLDGHIPTPNRSLAIQHFSEHVLFQAVYS